MSLTNYTYKKRFLHINFQLLSWCDLTYECFVYIPYTVQYIPWERKRERGIGKDSNTYIVAHLEKVLEAFVHAVMVHCHEEGVDDNTESDEQLNEGIKHQELDKLCKLDPHPTAVPHTKYVDNFQQQLD